jgi:hypothetical protein
MFNKVREVPRASCSRAEPSRNPVRRCEIGSILLIGSSGGREEEDADSPPTVRQAANPVHTLSQQRARATRRARMIVMTYVIKYTKPGQVESSVLLDITKMASAETVRNTAQQIAGVGATITAVDARP